MTISDATEAFGGKPVRDFDPGVGLSEAGTAAYRIAIDWERHENDEKATDLLAALVSDARAAEVTALLFGDWGGTAEGNDAGPIVEAIVSASTRLPNLTALFLGDMTFEECEISWIQQTNVSALFGAFPRLEELRIRGSTGLSLGPVRHQSLRKLVIESGGLGADVIAQVRNAEVPRLEHLELWLGDDGYGWDGRIDDVAPLLQSGFPGLKYLGLRNSQIADHIAAAFAQVPARPGLEVLDLSLGTMTDEGAQALSESTAARALRKLDVHHNYLTAAGLRALATLGIAIEASDQQQDSDGCRYVAVSE